MKFLLPALLFATTLFAQQPKQSKLPLSGYMRRTGLIYVETFESFMRDCAAEMTRTTEPESFRPLYCDEAQENYNRAKQSLDDRIGITLSESPTRGDVKFWKLLKDESSSARDRFFILAVGNRVGKKDTSLSSVIASKLTVIRALIQSGFYDEALIAEVEEQNRQAEARAQEERQKAESDGRERCKQYVGQPLYMVPADCAAYVK